MSQLGIKSNDDQGLTLKKKSEEKNSAEDMASNIKTNHGYITFFTVTFLFGSTLQGGWALAECGQVSLVLDKKLNWGVFSRD